MNERVANFPEFVDSSMLSSAACQRRFFYQYVLNLVSYDPQVHLHAGKVLAAALQTSRLAFYRDGESYKDAVYAGMRTFIREWGEFEAPEHGSGKFKDFVNVMAAFIDYCRQYHFETDHIKPMIKANGEPSVEFTFAIPLPVKHPETGQPMLYTGRSDMVGMYNSMPAIVDEKTTYSFNDNWAKQFQLRGQFIGYCWAGQQAGLGTRAAVARGIGIQVTAIKHQEAIMMYPQWQIDRWYEQMLGKVQYLVDLYIRFRNDGFNLEQWPMSYGDACTSYSGCEMMDLCTSENPENWYSTFGTRNWNPLD